MSFAQIRHTTSRLAWLVPALGALMIQGCAIFPPLGEPVRARLDSAWGTRVYELEMLAYHPSEPGSPVWMRSDDTPEGGIVVVPRRDREVSAFDAETGRHLWDLKTLGSNTAAPVAIEGTGELIVASGDGHVYRVQQRNGRVVWKSELPGYAMVAAPVIARGAGKDAKRVVVVTSLDNRVTVLDLETGARLWSAQRDHDAELTISGQSGALVVGDRVYAGFSDGVLAAWALEDGATLWNADLRGDAREFVDIDATPIAVEGDDGEALIVASVFKRGIFAVTAEGGDIAWQVRGESFGDAAFYDGLLVVPQASGKVWAVDAATGTVRWISDVHTGWVGRPIISQKYVIVPTGVDLVLLDRGSGRVLERWNDGRGVSGTPFFAWGRLYVATNAGMLHALDVY